MNDLFEGRGQTATQAGTVGYRWTLLRRFAPGPLICWIGLNPSSADAKRDDPTTRRWSHYTRAWGYAGYVAVNLYPLRTSDPAQLRNWIERALCGADWDWRDHLQENLRIVSREAKRAARVLACWGATAWDEDWTEEIIESIQSGAAPYPAIECLGRTASGAPIHPMARGRHRVSDDATPVIWRAA